MHILKDFTFREGIRVLLRLDLNLPLKADKVIDDYRIRRSMPTMEYLRTNKARIAIVGHIENEETDSLGAVSRHLNPLFPHRFAGDPCADNAPDIVASLPPGDAILFENLRCSPGEKANDCEFAKRLSRLGEIFVNEAFSASHRYHASVVSVPSYLPSYAGLLFADEVEHLSRTFNPPHPFLFIIGGAKFETKLPLIDKFVRIADYVFVGGALANDFFRAKHYEVGISLTSSKIPDLSKLVTEKKIVLPPDVVVIRNEGEKVKKPQEVEHNERILDAGPETSALLDKIIRRSKFVLWNGPLGFYEEGYTTATHTLAQMLAGNRNQTIVGGGDTLAAIQELNLEDKFTFVSTGGGAMLQFLASGTLPGIEALERAQI